MDRFLRNSYTEDLNNDDVVQINHDDIDDGNIDGPNESKSSS